MQRVRALAAERGGHVSFRAFLSETGVKEKWLRGQEWWAGWNNLLSEIGLPTRVFDVPRTPLPRIVEAVAVLIEREGRWPTDDDLARERKRDVSFPSVGVISPIRRSGALAKGIVSLEETSGKFAKASLIAKEHQPAEMESGDTGPNERVKGYVYLLRTRNKYKIGKSVDPSQRYREVSLLLPDETHQVHTIPTDDPTGIELYWQKRFASKRIRKTEFFLLDADDVQAFKRRKYQ